LIIGHRNYAVGERKLEKSAVGAVREPPPTTALFVSNCVTPMGIINLESIVMKQFAFLLIEIFPCVGDRMEDI
jgi:hypothetical protein